jgi:acetyl esterase/lipase
MKKIAKYSLLGCGTVICLLIMAAIGMKLWWHHLQDNGGYTEDWADTDGLVERDLAYGDGISQRFDLFIPASASKERTQALLLFIHGGAWNAGDKVEQEFACRRYAKAGYFTAQMNYTLIGNNNPEANLTTMLDEIQMCVNHIVEYSKSKGYQLDQMALGGLSAGGHLALLYGLKCADQSPLPIAFIASRVGPTDLTEYFTVPDSTIQAIADDVKAGRNNPNQQEIERLVRWVSGQTLRSDQYTRQHIDSLLLSASPVTYVNRQSAPVLLAYGGEDSIVRPIHAHRIDSLLEASEVSHQLVMFPHSGHFLDKDPDCAIQFVGLVHQYCKQYLGERKTTKSYH